MVEFFGDRYRKKPIKHQTIYNYWSKMIIHEATNTDEVTTIVLLNGFALCAVYEDDADNEIAWLANVRVHPKYRGNGYGNTLIAKAVEYAQEKGYKKMQLAAAPDWHCEWYQRHGFRVIQESYCGRVILQREL